MKKFKNYCAEQFVTGFLIKISGKFQQKSQTIHRSYSPEDYSIFQFLENFWQGLKLYFKRRFLHQKYGVMLKREKEKEKRKKEDLGDW